MAIRQLELGVSSGNFQEPMHTAGMPETGHPLSEGVFIERLDSIEPDEVTDTTRIYRRKFEIAASEVEASLEVPHELSDETPLIVLHGYGGIKSAYYSLRNYMAANGKATVTYAPGRKQKGVAALHPKHLLHPDRLVGQSGWAVMRGYAEEFGIQQYDAVGHSMGGKTLVEIAKRHPERIRSGVFMASAGLENHNLLMLAGRVPRFIQRELVPSFGELRINSHMNATRHLIEYVLRNPWRTLGEGISVAECDIRDDLKYGIGATGIKSAGLVFASDELINAGRTASHSSGLFDSFMVHPEHKLGHLGPQVAPEAVGKIILELIKEINNPVAEPEAA